MKKGKILLVDDVAGVRKALEIILSPVFAEVRSIPSPNVLISTLEDFRPDVVLLDMNFTASANTGGEGLYWLTEIKNRFPRIEVVLFTAYADVDVAVEGMKRGAFDFIVKPWDNTKMISTLQAAYNKSVHSSSYVTPKADNNMYWGDSEPMRGLHYTLEKVAPTSATVLITGENGVGKDLLARAIHAGSQRSSMPFVALDASAVPQTLFESELFGHVKGAFTGAQTNHKGRIVQAEGGTLFLDEIGNIPLHLQAKLLRVLQEKTVCPVGGNEYMRVDFRLICATNANLSQMVEQGQFREDLYYRINTVHLHVPALRERPEDIVPLSELFIARYADKYHRQVKGLDHSAVKFLRQQPWKGNIRQLQNSIEKAVILSEGDYLTAADFNNEDQPYIPNCSTDEQSVRDMLQRYGGNISAAAKALGISRPTLYAKLKKYGL